MGASLGSYSNRYRGYLDTDMNELVSLRQENSKTFDLGDGKHAWEGTIGAIHYKDDYSDKSEAWKDIDLTWEGNCISKAQYELTLEGKKITVKDKKTGEVSTIELLEIGGEPVLTLAWSYSEGLARVNNIAAGIDLEVVAGNTSISAHVSISL